MQFLWKYIDELIGKGLEFNVIAEFLLYTTATLVPLALPLSVLLASLMTFGNLAENLELLALKSSGISLFRIMAPIMFISFVISIFALLFSNYMLPISNLKMRSLLYDIQQQRPELSINPGVFDNTLEGYSIRIGARDSKTSLLRDIWIYDHTDKQGNINVTVADSGYMRMTEDEKQLLLTLYNGKSYTELQKQKEDRQKKTYPHRRDRFEKQELIIEMTGFGLNRTDENLFKNSYSMLNLSQLRHFEDSLGGDVSMLAGTIKRTLDKNIILKPSLSIVKPESAFPDSIAAELTAQGGQEIKIYIDTALSELSTLEKRRAITQALNDARSNKAFVASNASTSDHKIQLLRRYQIEKHRKYTLSILCLIFFFVGAPMGAIIRKGGLGMPVIVSVVFFIIYYIISLTGEKFVRESIMYPFWGMWGSTFILVPVSIFLTYKAANDSVIMNIETYFGFLKKIGIRLKKIFLRYYEDPQHR